MKKNRFPKHVFMNAKMKASNHNEFFFYLLAFDAGWPKNGLGFVIQDYRYLDIENVSCLLLLMMARMDIET